MYYLICIYIYIHDWDVVLHVAPRCCTRWNSLWWSDSLCHLIGVLLTDSDGLHGCQWLIPVTTKGYRCAGSTCIISIHREVHNESPSCLWKVLTTFDNDVLLCFIRCPSTFIILPVDISSDTLESMLQTLVDCQLFDRGCCTCCAKRQPSRKLRFFLPACMNAIGRCGRVHSWDLYPQSL